MKTRLRSLVSSSSCLSMWCHLQLDEYSRCIWMNEWIWDLDKRAAGKSVFVSIIFILFSGPSTKLLVLWPGDHSQPGVEQYVAQFVEDHRTQDHNDASDIDNGKGKTSKQKKRVKMVSFTLPPSPLLKEWKIKEWNIFKFILDKSLNVDNRIFYWQLILLNLWYLGRIKW